MENEGWDFDELDEDEYYDVIIMKETEEHKKEVLIEKIY